MSKKTLISIGIVLSLILILGGWFWWQVTNRVKPQTNQEQEDGQEKEQFVTDVDPDVNHWQMKETEFFTIKFPKEWYWLESDRAKTGYYSQIITNNPNFDINKYPDIAVFEGGMYPLVFQSDSEIVITTGGLGKLTSNGGTPSEYMESEIKRVNKLYNSVKCEYVSDINSIPLTVYCSFVDNNDQKVETYYVSLIKRTFAFTARTTKTNDNDIKNILEKISLSLHLKKDF